MKKFLKVILALFLLGLIIFGGLVLLNVIPLSGPQIIKAETSSDINQASGEPINVISEFKADTPSIYCAIQVKNIRGESEIKAEWVYESHKLAESLLKIPGQRYFYYTGPFYFELKKPKDANWSAGSYQIKIYLGDKLEKIVNFKVKEEEGEPKEAKIGEVTICSKVDENYAPTDKVEKFTGEVKKVYCSVKVNNAARGAKIRTQWWLKDKDQLVNSSIYSVNDDNSAGYIAFSYTAEGKSLEKGQYEVKVYVGDKLVKTANFEVR